MTSQTFSIYRAALSAIRWILFFIALSFWMASCQLCPAAETNSLTVWATAYSWREPEHSRFRDRNCLGGSLRCRIEGLDQIAVDPRLIPLGSIVCVEGFGRRIATDVGSAIRGRRIDIHFQTLSGMRRWSNRKLVISIERRGWKKRSH